MNRSCIHLPGMPIRFKMFVIFSMVFLTALVIAGVIVYVEVKQTITANIDNQLTSATDTILNKVQTTAQASIKNYLRAVAERNREIIGACYEQYRVGRLSEPQAKERARQVLFSQTIGESGYIYCLDSNGIAIEHPRPSVAGVNFSSFEFIQEQIRRKEGYLEYEWINPGETQPRPKALYMTYFQPWDWIISVSSYRDEFRQLINISDFSQSILSLRFGQTGYSYVIDSTGRVVVHPELSGNLFDVQDAHGRYIIRQQCESKSGKLVYSWKNPSETRFRDKIVIYNYIPEYDWIVSSTGYLEEFHEPLKAIRNALLTTLAVVLAVVTFTTFSIAGGITRPLRQLEKQLAAAAHGNYTGRMTIGSRDEIGNLARYFNNFMEQLERHSATIAIEVAQRRKTAEALQKSEERYRTILDSIEDGYFELDLDERFVFFNHAMVRIAGYARETLLGMNQVEITAAEDSRQAMQAVAQVKQTGQPMRASDWTIQRGDGSLCRAETSLSVIRDAGGALAGVRGVVRDVTEKRAAQEALRLSEEMFSKAFRASPSGIFIARLADYTLINANPSFLQLIGRTYREVIGKELTAVPFFQHAEDYQRLIAALNALGRVRDMELVFTTATGEQRTVVLSAESVQIWGDACVLCALEDLTETQRLEREIIDISEREHQKVGQYLHDDLCSHLLGIEVLHKVFRRKIDGVGANALASLDKIRDLVRQAIAKTRRISRGLCPVNIGEKGLDLVLQELCSDMHEIYGVSCTFRRERQVHLTDVAMATHIYYIAREAAYNAVKHGQATEITLSLSANGQRAELQILDNGRGIPKSLKLTGMGIRIMHYRARRIGADLEARRIGDTGSLVSLTFTVPNPEG